jgi:hypothetical protein
VARPRCFAAPRRKQLSRLTTPDNGFDGNKVSYSEYCRAQYDRAGNEFGTACTELARNRKAVRGAARAATRAASAQIAVARVSARAARLLRAAANLAAWREAARTALLQRLPRAVRRRDAD